MKIKTHKQPQTAEAGLTGHKVEGMPTQST